MMKFIREYLLISLIFFIIGGVLVYMVDGLRSTIPSNNDIKIDTIYLDDFSDTLETNYYWLSSEVGDLPIGEVISGEIDDDDPKINWLTISDSTGKMTMVRNIDPVIWWSINIGDFIK
jgi:hypothetical protein